MNKVARVNHGGHTFILHVPNYICSYRADSFHSKEPETLSWIDGFENESVFWDVGANIGLYSIYASVSRMSKTYAFEPSVFNLEVLARNIFSNAQSDRISIIPVALNNKPGVNKFRLQNTDWGGALSSFEHAIDYTGAPLKASFQFNTVGLTMDEVCRVFDIPPPDYLKIDVDGIEHIILEKGSYVLNHCREILIEYSGQWMQQSNQIEASLSQHGFKKKFTHNYDPKLNPAGSMNNIWVK